MKKSKNKKDIRVSVDKTFIDLWKGIEKFQEIFKRISDSIIWSEVGQTENLSASTQKSLKIKRHY